VADSATPVHGLLHGSFQDDVKKQKPEYHSQPHFKRSCPIHCGLPQENTYFTNQSSTEVSSAVLVRSRPSSGHSTIVASVYPPAYPNPNLHIVAHCGAAARVCRKHEERVRPADDAGELAEHTANAYPRTQCVS
jgi:hypothetical protein